MIVQLTPGRPPAIIDRDRVDRLHATSSAPLAEAMLEPTCLPCDDEHVWVSVDSLRDACAPVAGEDAFEATIDYATSKGWLNPSGTHVRAHFEPAN